MSNSPSRAQKERSGPVRSALDRLVERGEIDSDPAQTALADRLDGLDRELSTRFVASKKSALGWLFGRNQAPEPPRGLYIHGDVGRGKSMIMDLFYRRSSVARKRRVHFHAFMADVHERIGAHREAVKAGKASGDDPIPPVAGALAGEARLLCFDEFSVTDIADAMILSRLFKALFDHSVVLVATSNVAPDDLYRDGLNRALFLPFVETLKAHTDVFELKGTEDYRLAAIGSDNLYVTPLGAAADETMERTWRALLDGAEAAPTSFMVKGRKVTVPSAGNGAARFIFADLLGKALGAQDYLAIAKRFHTVLLEGVPVMEQAERNEAKRFITLVDTLYDCGRRLIVSAEAKAEDLYRSTSGNEAFEFERTVSRLHEMRSDRYLEEGSEGAGPDRSG